MFGLGLPELIILLIVFGGLAFALRRRHDDAGESGLHLELAFETGRPSARKWVVGGLLVALVCGLALLAGGWFIGLSRAEHRVEISHGPAQADPHGLDRDMYPPVDLPRAYQDRFHTGEVPPWVRERQREIEARAQAMQGVAEERRVAAKSRAESWERVERTRREAWEQTAAPGSRPAYFARGMATWTGIVVVLAVCVLIIIGAFLLIAKRFGARIAFGTFAIGMTVLLLSGIGRSWHLQQVEDARRAESQTRLRALGLKLHNNEDDVSVTTPVAGFNRLESHSPVVAQKPLPDWITAAGDPGLSQVVVGSQFANRQDAFADALDKATNVVSEEFRQSHSVGRWDPDGSDVYTNAVREKYTEEIIRTAGENEFTVYRTYLLVDLSPSVISKLESIWRTETKALHRSQVLILVAILTGIAALLAGFFRLDDRTKGRYRWPLIGATVVGIALLAAVPVLAGDCIERCQQRHSMLEIEPQRREGHKGFAKNCVNPPRHGSCFADE